MAKTRLGWGGEVGVWERLLLLVVFKKPFGGHVFVFF